MHETVRNIQQQIKELGFDHAGITNADLPAHIGTGLEQFLNAGHHGDMAWMAKRVAWRRSPKTMWPEARSIIMLSMNYGPDHNPLSRLQWSDCGNISVYAQNKDYHDIIKKRLKRLGRWLCETYSCQVKIFVDTAPVMEKPLAAQAGLGWQAKHTNLVSRHLGSWFFLGAVYTTLELPASAPEKDHCGTCRKCLDICPTNAFPAPYKLDARKCISYLTIELKSQIPIEFRRAIGNRIYGCDDCLAVCPWNKFASQTQETAFHPRRTLQAPLLSHLLQLDDRAFREMFQASPVKRIGRDRFIRNVLVATGNSNNPALVDVIEHLLNDPAPLIRGMAIWALNTLAPTRARNLRQKYAAKEQERTVIVEWERL